MVVDNGVGLVSVVKVRYYHNFCTRKGKKLSNTSLDSKYTYSEITYVTKSAYAGDTGCCGALILAMEHRLNGILGCPEQIRTGKIQKIC